MPQQQKEFRNRAVAALISVYRGYNRARNGARTIGSAAVIFNESREIVLVRLAYRSGWGLPGGFCARHEPPDETVKREVDEETSIQILSLPVKPTVLLDKHHRHLSFIYEIESDTAPKRPTDWLRRLEIREVGQFHLSDLPRLHLGTEDMLNACGLSFVKRGVS